LQEITVCSFPHQNLTTESPEEKRGKAIFGRWTKHHMYTIDMQMRFIYEEVFEKMSLVEENVFCLLIATLKH